MYRSPLPAAAALLLCVIVGITDGDTLTARCEAQTIKVRLAEVDAPEHHQPFGTRSREHLAALCFNSAPRSGPSRPAAASTGTGARWRM